MKVFGRKTTTIDEEKSPEMMMVESDDWNDTAR
jgi:hypothetical protein